MNKLKIQPNVYQGKKIVELPDKVPLIPTRDLVVFPNAILPLIIGRPKSIEALDAIESSQGFVLVATQKQADKENIRTQDIYRVGTLTRVLQILRLPNNYIKIVIEGVTRARISRFLPTKNYFKVKLEYINEPEQFPEKQQASLNHLLNLFKEYIGEHPDLPDELISVFEKMQNPYQILDFIALNVEANIPVKQRLLETASVASRIKQSLELLSSAVDYQNLRKDLDSRVRENMMQHQKQYYLQEQLKIIKKELGEEERLPTEIQKLDEGIRKAQMPGNAHEKSMEELEKLKKTPPFSPEYTVTRNYLEWMTQVPWSGRTQDKVDVVQAQQILDEDHYGLAKPKERILEHLAVIQRVKKIKGPILCFVGPPGVGKTSLGRSVARALGRRFVRVSLGGVRDEAEIRGHRRTYIGSMPGKIIQSLKRAGTRNPVFLMDEVDKMSMDFRGDPSAALLEVLDPEQNKTFNDHYLDVDYDLSEVFFITTANVQSNIPLPLQDRMEIIELPGYLEHEKIQIAKRHLIPKQFAEHGLSGTNLQIAEEVLLRLIREYTREAGVRNLERQIANMCRKVTRKLLESNKTSPIKITTENLETYLGKPPYLMRRTDFRDEVGLALGVAWTSYGGDILKIEANTFPGKGQLSLTGKLGEVMKESGQTALSYIRSIAAELNITQNVFQKKDIHLHVPEGAVPKDGPSAGITLATAMVSALTGRAVRGNIAMTGEITLRGKILAIGGFNEKMLAAQRNNIPTVIVPRENKKEAEDLPPELREGVTIIQVDDYKEVLQKVLL